VGIPANILIPAAAGIIGAVVGSISPVVVGLLQQRGEHRRERIRLAVQLAIEADKQTLEQIKTQQGTATDTFIVPPLAVNVVYFAGVLDLLAGGKEITRERVTAINAKAESVATPEQYPSLAGAPPSNRSP
jgi:hypothetical protein